MWQHRVSADRVEVTVRRRGVGGGRRRGAYHRATAQPTAQLCQSHTATAAGQPGRTASPDPTTRTLPIFMGKKSFCPYLWATRAFAHIFMGNKSFRPLQYLTEECRDSCYHKSMPKIDKNKTVQSKPLYPRKFPQTWFFYFIINEGLFF